MSYRFVFFAFAFPPLHIGRRGSEAGSATVLAGTFRGCCRESGISQQHDTEATKDLCMGSADGINRDLHRGGQRPH